MVIAKKILQTIDSHTISQNRIYKSKTSKYDGKVVECEAFPSPIGTTCEIECNDKSIVTGEIIGFKENKNIIAVHENNANIILGSEIRVLNSSNDVIVGSHLLGRVLDAFGNPLDGGAEINDSTETWPINGKPNNPMSKKPINAVLDVGIRAINSLFTVGRGQRLGIIAGSGVGKSILLGMMTKFTDADVVVVALIGERGRELGNFVSEILNDESR